MEAACYSTVPSLNVAAIRLAYVAALSDVEALLNPKQTRYAPS